MASTKKAPKKAPKKGSRRIQSVRVLTCSRCGLPTTHTLYDTENKVYKCTICGSTIKL